MNYIVGMNKFVHWFTVLSLCVMMSNGVRAQFSVSEQKDTSRSGTVYTFPVFNSTRPDRPHEAVNRWLQERELELYIGEQDSSIFEKIWPPYDQPYSGTTQFDYKVVTNTRKILTVEFDQEGCGAYCEGFSTYYNFDATTGNFIELAMLFTDEGMKAIATSITKERVAVLKAAIQKATDEDAKSMYEQCLKYVQDPESFGVEFYIEKTKIHFLRGRCSNHAMQALDDIGDFDNVRSFAQLHPYLSDWGKKLLY